MLVPQRDCGHGSHSRRPIRLELAELARHGLGVAIVPQSVARGGTDLHPLQLVPELRGRLVWAWRSDIAGPAARRLRDRAVR